MLLIPTWILFMKESLCFRNLDDVIGNLAKNFAEGTEYFKVYYCIKSSAIHC